MPLRDKARWIPGVWTRLALKDRCAVGAVTGLAMLAGLALGCSGDPTGPSIASAAATVAQLAAAATGQSATLANNYKEGRNLGFDTSIYPGDHTMETWKTTPGAPYRWVGYYLPAPCHKDASWTGKREKLTTMGWGLAVVYVGQQTWEKSPKNMTPAQMAALERQKTCDVSFLGSARGANDGRDAVARTAAEGFAVGSTIFLDIERTEKVPPALRNYYVNWARAVLADGRFRPGAYTHAHNATQVYSDLKATYAAASVSDEPRIWVAHAKGFDTGKAPQDAGFAFAGVWQGLIDVGRSVANVTLPVDVNISSWRSPSAPSSTRTAD